jgi:hypothetical protein
MSDVIKSVLGGLAKFVMAGIVPSAISMTVFLFVVLGRNDNKDIGQSLLGTDSTLAAAGVFGLAVVALSLVFAYSVLPVYRLLEGYTLPRRLQRALRKRQLRKWYRLKQLAELGVDDRENRLHLERLEYYPDNEEHILPTSLGNALKAMELYGKSRFELDSQTFWYELQAVATPTARRDTEDARTAVDFFISSIINLVLLATASVIVGTVQGGPAPFLVAAIALLLAPFAYRAAVFNVLDWRYSVQALVNVSRVPLAESLGMQMPRTFEAEREMWRRWSGLVYYGPDDYYFDFLNWHRRPVDAPKSGD